MTYVDMIEDTNGDLVDQHWFCSSWCYNDSTGKDSYGHQWPGGSETDYNVYCHRCEDLMWTGIEVS